MMSPENPLSTPPLSPKIIATLAQWGVVSIADLQVFDPCRAFLLLKKTGFGVTQKVFWQLVALSCEKDISQLNINEREFWQTKLREMPPVALFPSQEIMESNMCQALIQADLAVKMGEIPVGAVVVHHGNIIAQAHNRCIHDCDVSRHAEIHALAQAGRVLGNYRLHECDVYVNLEPCMMCAGALIQARVARVIFGAHEPKMGAAGSVLNAFADKKINTHTAILGGILADESRARLQDFFRQRRG